MPIAKVLMIDDDPDIRKVGQLSLKAFGKWQVVLASNGQEGIELAAKEQPDLILLDVLMPGIDGPTTFAKLREQESTRSVPVIFMTAKTEAQDVARYTSLGAIGVIGKPFDPMKLPAEVRKIVDGAASSVPR
jgi:CheY-like chemotaxis protein